jgi:hypothetical protein
VRPVSEFLCQIERRQSGAAFNSADRFFQNRHSSVSVG